ncbi:MAG: glycosyltransferase family 9 protein [Candidatus Omnitrophica bacterium]|nr:glycosyltransferase family 9 protein [Candidatus Omnitrophota bacterium]
MNFLVIRVGNIGDVFMATPVVRALRKTFPDSAIDFVTSPQAHCAVKNNSYVRRIFVYRKCKNFLGALRRNFLIGCLLRRKYDACFILEEHPQYKEFAFHSTGKQCIRIGFSGEGEQGLNFHNKFSHDKHVIENNLHLVRDYYQISLTGEDLLMDFVLPNSDECKLSTMPGRYALIHPGVTQNLPYRGWRAESIAQTIRFLREEKLDIVLTGQKNDQKLLEEIVKHCSLEERKHVHLVVDRSFEDLALFIKRATVVLCSDTGILHIARALNIPVLGLFGPSNPHHTGGLGPGIHRFIRNDFVCGPCNYSAAYRFEEKKNCLDGKIPACMASITVEQVRGQLKDILVQRGSL